MNKWFVMKSRHPERQGTWFVGKLGEHLAGGWFPTWQEAMDYVCRQIRLGQWT